MSESKNKQKLYSKDEKQESGFKECVEKEYYYNER